MDKSVIKKIGDVRIYGKGSTGGKGAGIIKINESNIPKTHKLSTRILAASFFSKFKDNGGRLDKEDLEILCGILETLGNIPISVRSSATNEGFLPASRARKIRAGENTSFMLPNNHAHFSCRVNQLKQAIYHIYNDFITQQQPESQEEMAIVINPIPGIFEDTLAGPVYYPLVSGVANSFSPYALKIQDPNEGFARVAFGHGYATVLDDFPVISMSTIKNPIPLRFLKYGNSQHFFYAIDMTKNKELKGNEMETMKKLHIKFADFHKISLLGGLKNMVSLEEIIQNNRYGFRSCLTKIMESISAKISSHFQIEFVFNPNFKDPGQNNNNFHVVQLTQLPEKKITPVRIPKQVKHTYLSINNLQGQGVKRGLTHAIVVSPFTYSKNKHDDVKHSISSINRKLKEKNEKFILIVPGRLGSKNRDWGIFVDYQDVNGTVAIFEYGVDIAGRPEPLPEEENLSGGIYGSHFLYMIQGGFDEEQKKYQTRMYGTQGTHFLTNLMSTNTIYGYIIPDEDTIDPWFFTLSKSSQAVNILTFPKHVNIYADSLNQKCVIASVYK